jgi:hypothetical protein
MLKIIVTNLIGAIIANFTQRADMVASTTASARDQRPAGYGHDGNWPAAGATEQISHAQDTPIDYAAILRIACLDGRQHAVVSCDHALGAAAEIEQLWAALSIMVDYTSDSALPTSRVQLKASLTGRQLLQN